MRARSPARPAPHTVATLATVALLLGPAAAAVAQDVRFSPDATVECLESGNPESDCLGASANACMQDTPGGFSTAGMNACLDRERAYWDTRLNAAYRPLMDRHRREDAATRDQDRNLHVSLQAMQRAWITYRDGTCAYESAFWTGGSGANTVTLSCHLRLTGAQALYLERVLDEDQ